jgi:outer membrane receptor protein involved in Fe transport
MNLSWVQLLMLALVASSAARPAAADEAPAGPTSSQTPDIGTPSEAPAAPPATPETPTARPAAETPAAGPPPETAPSPNSSEVPARVVVPEARVGETSGPEVAVEPGGLEDLSLERMLSVQVRSASFFVLPAEKVPNTSYRLDFKSFSRLPVRTLADLLDATVPGLFVGNDRFAGPVLAQRGAMTDSNAKTVVMLDGQNLNQRFAHGYNMALSLPLLGDIDTVEVIQGPGAILYGSGSISGFVNMLPKSGRTSPGLTLTSELGPFDVATTMQTSYGLTYGPRKANDLFIYAGLARAGGFVPDAHDWNQGRGIDLSSDRQGGVQPSGKVTLNWHDGHLRLKGQYLDMWSTQAGGMSGDQPTGWHEGYLALRPEYAIPLTSTQDLTLVGSLMLHESGFAARDGRELLATTPTSSTTGDTQKRLPYTGRESSYTARLVYRLRALARQKIAAGAEFATREFAGNKAWFYPVPRDVSFDSLSRWNEYSAFAEDVVEYGALLAVAGLRYDLVDFQGGYFVARDSYDVMPKDHVSQVSPRLSLAYQLGYGLSTRIAYQRGFRVADADDLQDNRRLTGPGNRYWTPVGQFGGPTWTAPPAVVAPETVDSVELNVHDQKTFRTFNLIGDVNGYYSRFDHYIVYDVGQRNAVSPFASVGGEIVAKVQTRRGDTAQLSYAYSRPVGLDAATAQEIQLTDAQRSSWRLYYPHQIKLSGALIVPGFAKALSIGAAARYYSGLPVWNHAEALAATADPTWNETARSKPLIAVSASAIYDVTSRLQLKLIVENSYHNGTPVSDLYAGHPELTAVGLDRRLFYLTLVAKVD